MGANLTETTGRGQGADEDEDLAVSGLRRRSRSAAGDVELPSRCRPCAQRGERRRRPRPPWCDTEAVSFD
jgi:hypothetical protein